MSACSRAGDNCGLVVFGRKVRKFLPPKRGLEHIDAVLEALHDLEPELIEPSYARAFQFIASNLKKRAFVVILTDLVDKDSSQDLIRSLKLLRPRHLPLVATIGDRDLGRSDRPQARGHQRSIHAIRRRGDHPPTRNRPANGRIDRRPRPRRNHTDPRTEVARKLPSGQRTRDAVERIRTNVFEQRPKVIANLVLHR